MLGIRCHSDWSCWHFTTVLAMLETLAEQPGQQARRFFLKSVGDDSVARALESRLRIPEPDEDKVILRGDNDLRILEWFEAKLIPAQSPSPGAVIVPETVEEYEQRSVPCFADVCEWLIPRFWSDPTNSEHARAVVARLREAYSSTSVSPKPWLLDEHQSFASWVPSSIFEDGFGLRSAVAVAYWAYYLEKRTAMSPALRLRYLAVLSRWYPAQAWVHAWEECWPSTRDPSRMRLLRRLVYTISCSLDRYQWDADGFVMRSAMARRMIWDMQRIADHLVDEDETSRETQLRNWTNTIVQQAAEIRHERYLQVYRERRVRVVSAYFSKLLCWQVRSEDEARFPVGEDYEFVRLPSFRRWVRVEEQLVCHLVDLLIDQHVADCRQMGSPQTREDVICSLRREERFRFSASEETFNQLYDRSVRETAARVAAEEAYEYAWKASCNAITLVSDVAAAIDEPLLVPPSPSVPTQWGRFTARPLDPEDLICSAPFDVLLTSEDRERLRRTLSDALRSREAEAAKLEEQEASQLLLSLEAIVCGWISFYLREDL